MFGAILVRVHRFENRDGGKGVPFDNKKRVFRRNWDIRISENEESLSISKEDGVALQVGKALGKDIQKPFCVGIVASKKRVV